MDFNPLFEPLFQMAKWFVPLLLVITLLKTPWFKGHMGEFAVNLAIKLRLNKATYHLLKNVTLPTEDGSTQIDHVIVSIYGVFIVETKNMKGWIFGGQNQKTWTQKIYRCSNKFQNPLHQNYKHTRTLQSLLGLADEQIFSLIAFVGDATFKTPMPENVTSGNGFIRYIKARTTPVFSHEQVMDLISKIENGRLAHSFKTNRDHVAHVRSIIVEKAASPTCPKCGSSMVSREVKRGANAGSRIWGCTRYPACRGLLAPESGVSVRVE
jgi:restriction system protein